MAVHIGPVLFALPSTQDEWKFAVQITVDAADAEGMSISSPSVGVNVAAFQTVARFNQLGWSVLFAEVTAKRNSKERGISYVVSGPKKETTEFGDVAVPAKGRLPRFASFSCNGFMHERDRWNVDDPGTMWGRMFARHKSGLRKPSSEDPSGFHLLVGGGDQVYADENATLINFHKYPKKEQATVDLGPKFINDCIADYLNRYKSGYGVPEIRQMMACVPGVYTWDDHDIMDGWGSFGKDDKGRVIETYPAYTKLFGAALRTFEVFQVGGHETLLRRAASDKDAGHFLQWIQFRETDGWLDVILLDLRTHRTADRVMSEAQWQSLGEGFAEYIDEATKELAGLTDDLKKSAARVPRHVIVVSSIPVVYLRYSTLALGGIGLLQAGLKDDLLDQWEHPAHESERSRLIGKLLDVRAQSGAQVTLISGDVHVAAHGRIVSRRTEHLRTKNALTERDAVIEQVTTSAIVNAPPSAIQMFGIEAASSDEQQNVRHGIYTEMVPVDSQNKRVRSRNFAALSFDPPAKVDANGRWRGQMWVEWVIEDGPSRVMSIDP